MCLFSLVVYYDKAINKLVDRNDNDNVIIWLLWWSNVSVLVEDSTVGYRSFPEFVLLLYNAYAVFFLQFVHFSYMLDWQQ